jgi:DNA-binding LacI/PurR family transcriptional regulator
VACGRVLGYEQSISSVMADDRSGARSAVEHLANAGCRRIATITGPQDMGAGQDRLAGYRRALADARVPEDADLVVAGDFSEASGLTAMRSLLERRPDVDAVFAANDPMAAGALRAIREAGRSVPAEVAVLGFDDSPLARVTEPALSTVRQPVEEMGRRMAELLVRLIGGGEVESPLVLPTELVVRASS